MYTLIKADENTWAYEDRMPDGDTVRFFVLDGKDRCLVIDTGYLELDVKGMVKDLLKTNGRDKASDGSDKEVILANTHGDMDHTGGNGSFDAFYMTETDYRNCRMKEKFPDCTLVPAEDGTCIDLGGRILEYIMAPGHTYGNAVILDRTDRVLFPGDMVQTGGIFMFGGHRCPDRLEESLMKLYREKGRFDRIYSCHGRMVLEPDAVDETLKAWKKVQNKEVASVQKEMFGNTIFLYDCGFCSFLCDPER